MTAWCAPEQMLANNKNHITPTMCDISAIKPNFSLSELQNEIKRSMFVWEIPTSESCVSKDPPFASHSFKLSIIVA